MNTGRVGKSSPEAREGTAAHSLMEMYFTKGIKPEEMIDRGIVVPGQNGEPDETVYVDEEMADSIHLVIAEVEKRRMPDTRFLFETEMDLSVINPNDPLLRENGGTADIIIFNYYFRVIHIIDLKYGKGVAVAGDDPQLMDYGVLAVANYPHPDGEGWKWVETVVVQPRMFSEAERVKPFYHPIANIVAYTKTIMESMQAAYAPDAPLVPTDKGCRWCLAAADCPALASKALSIVQTKFTPVVGQSLVGDKIPDLRTMPVFVPPEQLTPEQIGIVLERRDAYDAWANAVEKRAVQLLNNGIHIPAPNSAGFTLAPRKGNRKLVDIDATVEVLKTLGVAEDDMYQPRKLKSPTQIEATTKSHPNGKAIKALLTPLSGNPELDLGKKTLVFRPLGEPQLVPVSDQNPPVKPRFQPNQPIQPVLH